MSTLTGDWQFWKCLRDSSALSKCKRSRKKFRRSYPHSFSLHSPIIGSWDRKDCVCKENVTKTRNGKRENTSANGDLPPLVDTRLSKTKHPRKRFQNFRQSCMLSTDRIEIHQSQPLVWPSDLDNTHDWRKFWKRFRGCFLFESRVSTKTVVTIRKIWNGKATKK